jgi:hypothetical protein
LNLEYEKIDIKKMDDQTIASLGTYYVGKLAPYLGPNGEPMAKFKERPEKEQRVMGMWQFSAILLAKEQMSRNSNRQFWANLGKTAAGVVGVAGAAASSYSQQRHEIAVAAAGRPIMPIQPVQSTMTTTPQSRTTVQRDLNGKVTGWTTD